MRKIRTKMTKRPTGVLENAMQEDQKGCKKNNTRAEEEQTNAARTKQHEDVEEYTGIRPKKTKKNPDKSSEECDARRSERLQEEQHTY